ncbi:MAG: prephenate dehydrogenase [Micrococcales bacterium]|nr:prephenate dehydrogenase [Micrococcales bacterium]
MSPRTTGQVHIIGAGLLGTSIGLALRQQNVDVSITDASPANESLAIDFAAGRKLEAKDHVSLVVVCVPPDVTAKAVIQALRDFPAAVVTDVASVKSTVLTELQASDADRTRYVGSHPMAGREKGGTLAGRADLFVGRPWVIAIEEDTVSDSAQTVEQLALDLGSTPIRMSAQEHDHAVALISHTPQLISSLLAAQLASAEDKDLSLSGQGLRDTTRIAASDPRLWLQILSANSGELLPVLKSFEKDLEQVIESLEHVGTTGSLSKLGKVLEAGNLGISRLPGKHGSTNTSYAQVVVMIDDKPGELARLLTEIGAAGLNVEDLKLDHASGAQVGLVELSVLPAIEEKLVSTLRTNGWKLAG